MSILVVEDNPISSKILDINLQENGYEVVIANDAFEALTILETKKDISLIITDIMMPKMDGLQFILKIKQDQRFKKLPFIIASAMSNKKIVKKAIEMGCKHFIVKPVQSTQLIKLVKEILPNQRLILRDKHQTAAEMGLNIASYQKIANMFAQYLSKEIETLETELNEGKFKNLSIDLNQLRESATTLKTERLLDVLERVRKHLGNEDGRQLWNADKDYKVLLDEMKLLRKVLQLSLSDS